MDPSDDPDLGKLLFEKRPQFAAVAVPSGVAILSALCGLTILISLKFENQPDRDEWAKMVLTGIGACGFSVVLGIVSFVQLKSVMRVHESGVVHASPIIRRSVRFDQIDSFTFSRARQY